MVNDSEKVLNEFAEQYFFKDNILSDLKFEFEGQTQMELADLIIIISTYVLAIQLKKRNEAAQTEDVIREEKWLEKQCKEAKSQAKQTINYIKSGKLPEFVNNSGKRISISCKAVVVPVVMFMNATIKEYGHVLKRHSYIGYDVNCVSYEDFCEICKQLISPMEIVDYFIWRRELFKNAPKTELLLYDAGDSISIARPMIDEASVGTFIHARYGISSIVDDKIYLEVFRRMIQSIRTEKIMETEDGTVYFLTYLFSSFRRKEIRKLIEGLTYATELSKECDFGIAGIVRSEESKSVIFCVASESGNRYPEERLEKFLPSNMDIRFLVQIVVSWTDNIFTRTDYFVKKYI